MADAVVQYFGLFMVLAVGKCSSQGTAAGEIRGPVFVNEPPNTITFANNEGAIINCSAHGSPAPEMDWVNEEGQSIDNIDGYLHIFPNNSLYFPKFTGELQPHIHHTSYRCTAKNMAGSIVSRKVKVKAVKSELHREYNVQMNDQWVMEGNTAVLTCDINPSYIKEYVVVTAWVQGSTTVTHGGRFSIFPSTLHIRNIRELDGYPRYRCVTYNRLTKTEKLSRPEARLHIIPTANTVPNIEDSEDVININEGETLEIPCVASGFPYPSYSWKKDGVTVVSQDRIRYVQGNLEVKRAGISDSGTYECTITNRFASKIITTVVTVQKHISAYVTPAVQTIDTGGVAVFNCSVSGHPVDSIKWYKNGSPLVTTTRVVLDTPTSLRIHDVMRQDRGMYQCLVENSKESAQGTSQLSLGAAKPVFSEPPFADNLYFQPGPRVSLKCVVYGNPTPTITWKLDGNPIIQNSRFSVGHFTTDQGDVVSYVNITAIQVEDGGRYVCSASNDVGTLTHMGTIHVYGVPYIRPMPNITAVASQPLAIRCSVSGYPISSITWSKDGITLRTDHRVTVTRGGELTILYVQRSHDEGTYRCSAYNDNNEGMYRDVFVHVMEPPSITAFQFSDKLKQGQRVSVQCVVSSGDLPITITWLKDGKPLPQDLGFQSRKIDSYTSSLSTEDAVPRQNGNYTCVASNQAATDNYTATMHVDVPPRWVISPQDSFVILGQKVLIHCQTAGTPDPVVTWRKSQGSEPGNYQPIDFRSDSRLTQFPNGTLQITDARETDDSSYLCHSDNEIGTISRAVFLTVHIPATFANQRANYTITRGNNVTINCRAIGDTPMQISWRYNSAPLQQTPRYATSMFNFEKGYGSYLRIAPSEREDSGYYLCTAKNNFGFDQLLVHLIVQESPDRPENLVIEQSTSTAITISWNVPFNGHSLITRFIVQYKNKTDAWQGIIKNKTVAGTAGPLATITGLHPANKYDIRVLATNAIGTSEPSISIDVSTGEAAPSGPPLNVKVVAEDSQIMNVTWSPPEKSKQNGVILGYYIAYRKFNSSTPWRHSTVLVGPDVSLKLKLDNLEKFTRYTVQVQAYNAKGSGPSSAEVNVLTLEDVPSLPPTSVGATPLSSQSIMVVWSPPPLYTLNGILQGYKVLVKPVRDDEDESDTHIQTSTSMSVGVYGLQKYTNYSVQVLAYTRKGEGVRSDPIYVVTAQDVPGQPSDVKAFALNATTILVTWRPPLYANGKLVEYLVYQTSDASEKTPTVKFTVPSSIVKFYAAGLSKNHQYAFQVSAKTVVGEGEKTRVVTSSPVDEVAARIATFTHKILIQWKHDVLLPCDSIGHPTPIVLWKKRKVALATGTKNIRQLSNGSLLIENVQSSDAANYTCRASNTYGADEIIITLVVQVPPNPPKLSVAVTTSSTIQINWRSGSNGGATIRGFTVFYKKEHAEIWNSVTVDHNNRTYTAMTLSCGTRYKFKMNARNSEGPSIYSETLTTRTNGSTPISPAQSVILTRINSTFVTLNMATWQTGGCPITGYIVKYQVFGDSSWITVNNNINPQQRTFSVNDLHPATWYIMKVTAENEAGSTDIELKFATLTYEGSTIQPIRIVSKKEIPFYEQIYIIVPLCAGFIIIICTSLVLILYCKRRHDKLKNKEVTSNLRRDITAETSLMNDLDKRVNTDFEDDTNPENIRNVNLLIQLEPSEDNLQSSHDGNSSSWMCNQQSQSENSYPGTDDNAEMENRKNSECGPQLTTFQSVIHKHQSDDSIAAEKEQARRKMTSFKMNDFPPPPPELLSEDTACQTNLGYHHNSAPRKVRFKDVPEVSSKNGVLSSMPKNRPGLDKMDLSDFSFSSKNDVDEPKHNGDNSSLHKGVILSASKYASAEQINSVFYGSMRLPTPSSLILLPKSRQGSRPGSSAERGSHRASTLSSITTVSSSREELLLAYENARYNPNPGAEGFVENPNNRSSTSQPTDCSEGTEPGIRQFTQAPPRPEECRQSSCEVPMYEEAFISRRPQSINIISGVQGPQAPPPPPQRRKSPHRRSRGRNKPRNRGAVIGKKVIRAPRQHPRSFSRGSTVSTNSEDIYSVDERTYESPSEGYVSHHHDSYICTDSEYDPYSYRPRSRYTHNHEATPYPPCDSTPETPGCDERKPLVSALARTALASPNEEEEETSLLDRYYRPVTDNDSPHSNGSMVLHLTDSTDGHYTDNYTVV